MAVEDAFGNLISTHTSTVTIAVASGPGGLDGKHDQRDGRERHGHVQQPALGTAGTYTLTVTDGTLTKATSSNIVVSAATASQLLYQDTIATTGTAGQHPAPAVTVAVEDAIGERGHD